MLSDKIANLLHQPLKTWGHGIVGEMPRHSLISDDGIVLMSLLCIILTVTMCYRSRLFIQSQMRNMFRTPRSGAYKMHETANEVGHQIFLLIQGIIIVSLVLYYYYDSYVVGGVEQGRYTMMFKYASCMICCIAVRAMLAKYINKMFFDRRKNNLSNIMRRFFEAMMGVLLLPVALLMIYYNIPPGVTMMLTIMALAIPEVLYLMKISSIFFQDSQSVPRFAIYVCAIEVVPVVITIGTIIGLTI